MKNRFILLTAFTAVLASTTVVGFASNSMENHTSNYLIEQNGINASGTVVDEKGEPLIGVSVLEVGTTNGTVTNLDGKFNLHVKHGAKLQFSYVGYKPQTVTVNNSTPLKVTLQEDKQVLNEVVVIGYGTQKKRDVTTSIASISSKDLENKPNASVVEAMVGKMPGVQVTQNSGSPGGSLQVKVRGTGTITAGSSPLYVVDGMPLSDSDISSLNSNDIASIEVLKDASSAAIYGSRGANGVVIITTKSGSTGKMAIGYNGYYGVQSVSKKIDLLDAYEYADLVKDARNNSYSDKMMQINTILKSKGKSPVVYSINDNNALRLKNTKNDVSTIIPVELIPYLNREAGLTNTDWQDEIFRTAPIQNHSLSFRGGTKEAKYYASLDYMRQDGIIINSDFERYSGRFNLDAKRGIFNFGFKINPSIVVKNIVNADGAYNQNGVVASALFASPIFPVYNEDGSYSFAQNSWSGNTKTTLENGKTVGGNGQTWSYNPVALAELLKEKQTTIRLLGNVYAGLDLFKGLKYKINFGYDIVALENSGFNPSDIPLSNRAGNPASKATGTSKSAFKYNWTLEQTVNYKKMIKNHDISVLAGWTMQKELKRSNYLYANNFFTNDITTLNAGVVTSGNSRASEWTLLSALARIQYNYKGTYMMSAAIRADGASRFGKNNKWGYFPSVSAGWRISEEKFMKSLKFIDDLKLKASFGLTGNFNIPVYGALGEMDYVGYVLGGNTPAVVRGAAPTKMPNPDLHWEKTAQVNIGFDATLFNNMWTLGLDVYNSNTYDLLLNVPVPGTMGYSTRLENVGKVNNKGIEFNTAFNYNTKTLKWNTFFNISKNINKVTALGPGNASIISVGSVKNAYFLTSVGQPIGNYYLPVVEGVFKNQQELNSYPHYEGTPSQYGFDATHVGDFKFKDINGDKKIDVQDSDRAIVGNYQPKFTYGFGTKLEWKNFDLSIDFQGVYGNKILNLARRYFFNIEGNMNNYKDAVHRWKSEEDPGNGKIVRANRVAKGLNGVTSSWHVEDGSYLRLKNVTLGYSLPSSLLKKVFINRARIYTSINNALTFTSYKGYNPEVSNRTSATTSGEDYGVYPLARTFTFGINLSF